MAFLAAVASASQKMVEVIYRYRVTGSEVVNPDNRSVLVPDANGFHLTLTTCWPLWAGAFATQRYVIFTDQVWPVPIRPGYT